MFTPEQCAVLRRAAEQHSATAERFVLLTRYTGHRSSAIRPLRWSDIDLVGGTIGWRAEIDKIGYEHRNPLHPELVVFSQREQSRMGAIGDAWVFPKEADPNQPMSRDQAVHGLWQALRVGACIPAHERYGWQSFRRAFCKCATGRTVARVKGPGRLEKSEYRRGRVSAARRKRPPLGLA